MFRGNLLDLTDENNEQLSTIIENDSKFLRDHNIMDYSLLLSIESLNSK